MSVTPARFRIQMLFQAMAMGLVMAVFPLSATAQTGTAPPDVRTDCRQQADAKGLRSGPERQAFMRQCVHGSSTPAAKPAPPLMVKPPVATTPPPAAAAPPPDRTAECNKQANDKGLRGPERRDFMRHCMRP